MIPQDPWYGGEMIPVDFKQLKFNQQYKYHIRSLLAGHSHYSSLNIQGLPVYRGQYLQLQRRILLFTSLLVYTFQDLCWRP